MSAFHVPFFSLQQQVKNLRANIDRAFDSLLNNQQFIGGASIDALEQELAHTLRASSVITLNSGTDALWLALKALDIHTGDIVLTTPFSFIASSSEIIDHGAHAVFIDIDQTTFNINPQRVEEWLTQETIRDGSLTLHRITMQPVKGMIVVDLYGQLADYDHLERIAKKWNMWIIEDACQAIGAHHQERSAGTYGTVGTLSFYPTKNLGAFGDGGACITNDQSIAQRIKRLRNHGRASHYAYEELGINSRLDALQAEVLRVKLPLLHAWQERRTAIANYYHREFSTCEQIITPRAVHGTHSYHQYTIQCPNRTARNILMKGADSDGVGTRIFYPESLDQISFLQPPAPLRTECPIAHNMTERVLSLPIWPELSDLQVEHVARTIQAHAKKISPETTHYHAVNP